MTYSESSKIVGKEVMWSCGGLEVRVKVVDVKSSYGCVRYQIEPVAGKGKVWTEKITQIEGKAVRS